MKYTDEALTASDLAHIFRIPVATVYTWAHRDNWRRTTSKPRLYSVADAQASWDKRRRIPRTKVLDLPLDK